MGAKVLRFPGMGAEPKPEPQAGPAPAPAVDVFNAEQARGLFSTFLGVFEKAKALVGFMRKDMAGQAGVEWTWLEITTILESDRFVRMKDALTEAVREGDGVTLTHEGLGKLHRLEALVSEGMQTVERWKESGGKSLALSGNRLAQAGSSLDLVYLGAILVLGAVAITLVAVLAGKSNHSAVLAPVPLPPPTPAPPRVPRASSHPFFQRMR